MKRFALLSSFLVGGVLLFSAYTKLLSPQAFVTTIGDYGLLPSGLELMVATGVVALEFALAVLLITGIQRRLAATIAMPMFLLFVGLLVHAMRIGLESCGCFGEAISIPPPIELAIDIALVFLTGVVLWRGEEIQVGSGRLGSVLGWGSFLLGAALFLAAGPAVHGEESLEVTAEQLALLETASPPVPIPEDGLIFFFSADCPHCWSFAGAVEGLATRLEAFEVRAVTMSDPQALDEFRRDFLPSYPIHVVTSAQFHQITNEYPAAVWLQGGEIVKGWSGYVPSHREIANEGGYLLREDGASTPAPVHGEESAPPQGDSPFGGPVKG